MWLKITDALTYQETLKLVEKFMTTSRIREYCTTICKGGCCTSCYTSKEACHLHEGRRLICSAYVCLALKNKFCKKTKKDLSYIHSCIETQYTKYKDLTLTCGNNYFTSPDKTFLKIVRFPRCLKTEIEIIDIKEIKNIMNKLIKIKKRIR